MHNKKQIDCHLSQQTIQTQCDIYIIDITALSKVQIAYAVTSWQLDLTTARQ